MKDVLDQIDEVIHQKIRLGIMTVLAAEESADFMDLKQRLGLTDGNLSSHVTLLEKNQYISVKKSFVGRKPRTAVRITKKGRAALTSYLNLIKQIIEEG